ncbi:MAG: hypothetical protein NVS3B20_14220 [Polyangiales bacterium]
MSSDEQAVLSDPSQPLVSDAVRRFRVVYDPPSETKRMALMFLTCLVFSLVGVVLASRAQIEPGFRRQREKLLAVTVALVGGLLTMGLVSRRFRPGGGHAHGIVLELTDSELRLWGRGYGTRIAYRDVLRLRRRIVDTYLGRLGAMRQLRVAVEGAGRTIEVATEAVASDFAKSSTTDREEARTSAPEGGEGDCIVLSRSEFDAFESALLARLPRQG